MTHWQVYVKDTVCYALRDGKLIEMFSVGKRMGRDMAQYFRQHTVGRDDFSSEEVEAVRNALDSMKCVADFYGPFLFDRSKDMHFDGLARKIDKAGGIAIVKTMSEDEEEKSKATAVSYLAEARTYMSLGGSFKERAEQLAKEGAKHDPSNKEIKAFLDGLC
jgi:hypothetical protein